MPSEVLCGHHLPGHAAEVPGDTSMVVRIANAPIANAPRRVDFIHLPAVREAGRELFAPLSDLEAGEARISSNGMRQRLDELLRRVAAAREFLPSFGISHFCGHGRAPSSSSQILLRTPRGANRLSASHA
jgi:hypothetical protein